MKYITHADLTPSQRISETRAQLTTATERLRAILADSTATRGDIAYYAGLVRDLDGKLNALLADSAAT